MKLEDIPSTTIKVVGPVALPDGYGEMTRQLALGLIEAGHTVKIRSILFGHRPESKLVADEYEKLKEYVVEEFNLGQMSLPSEDSDVEVCVQCLTADNFPYHKVPGALNVGYCMWETSALPAHWTALLNDMDLIVVPSEFCRRVFQNSGVLKKIVVVPLGTDTTKFDGLQQNEDLKSMIEGRYAFYSIFQWSERKNPRALLEAYYSAFGSQDDVLLILKTYINSDRDYNQKELIQKVGHIRNSIKRNNSDYPKVMLITEHTTIKHIRQLHKLADCYLAPVRGEGWGYPPMDAALIGNHVIATDGQSYCDFLDTYHWSKNQLYDLIPFQEDFVHDMPGLYTADQKWAEIDMERFILAMKKAYAGRGGSEEGERYRAEYASRLKEVYDRRRVAMRFAGVCYETRYPGRQVSGQEPVVTTDRP